jgi:hypothetical protein
MTTLEEVHQVGIKSSIILIWKRASPLIEKEQNNGMNGKVHNGMQKAEHLKFWCGNIY